MLQGSLFGPVVRAGIYRQASRVSGSVSGRQFHAFSPIPTKSSGLMNSPKIDRHFQSSILVNMGMKLGFVRGAENVPLPCALSFRSFLHSGEQPEVEAGNNPKSTNHEQLTQESGNVIGKPPIDVGGRRNLRSIGYDELSIGRPPIDVGGGRNLRSIGYDELSMGKPPIDVGGGRNLRSIGYDELSIGKPPIDVGGGRNLRSFGYDELSIRERRSGVNAQLPLENQEGKTPMSMNYVQDLLHGSGVNGRPPHYPQDFEAGRIPRPMDDVQGGYPGRGGGLMGGPGIYNQPQLEANADIVHIKLMRNNSYVTLTDHRGNRKMSVSAGQVAAKGDKPGRYAGEAAAEYMGRVVKQMKIRSVVVKVSGFTFFRRKKDSILAFKDGYTHSRGDVNPIVYIEDTTRKPHNGCRLPKKRRI